MRISDHTLLSPDTPPNVPTNAEFRPTSVVILEVFLKRLAYRLSKPFSNRSVDRILHTLLQKHLKTASRLEVSLALGVRV
jgi:hypothetical protein